MEPTTTLAGPSGEVIWIDDGDTVEVDTGNEVLTVRLVATNAPDRGECFADDGLDHLIDTLKGDSVRLEVLGIDQFDRTLAYVFAGDRNVNLEMVGAGYSLASTPDEDDPYRQQMLSAESDAFTAATGLWSPEACGHAPPLPQVVFDPSNSDIDPPGDANDALANEFVTIVNNGEKSVALGGWILRDESTRHRYHFTSGRELAPGESLTISSNDPGWNPGDSSVWNNGGDMALLQLPDGTVIARWRY